MKFTIEAVSKMTGISAASLRNWEKRYGFPCPHRTDGGHRYYTAKDIDFLKKAMLMVDEGRTLNQVAEAYRNEVMTECEEKRKALRAQIQIPVAMDDVTYRVELMYQSLLNFDNASVLQHYCILNAKLSPEQLFDSVFEAVLRRIGKDRYKGKISTAQEHFASSFICLKLSSFLAIDFPPTQTKRIMLTTLSKEKHEGGLLLLSAHLKFRGYPVFYFGCGMPVDDLGKMVEELKPDVLCLSYIQSAKLREDVKYLKDINVPVCVGGLALFDEEVVAQIKPGLPEHIHLCTQMTGSEAAQFLEMVCQCKPEAK